MSEQREFPIPLASDAEIAEFIARFGKPYDPETDAYECGPFVADIREGKNDPIYNAHSYHTKVPPRAIIPYILHYTQPGDIVLDPFCGSGMTGVAAMMCAAPPRDILEAVPGAKKGARRAILNDLSPAACHIAYNYCTPVDVAALKLEFERIKEAVEEEFAWLYGTEHYEPAVSLYEPTRPEVLCRLKNPPANVVHNSLLLGVERTWELLDRAEVERRLGPATLAKHPLPKGIQQFVGIPATVQYTIWSDVYKCQGMVTVEEPTGRTNKRTGKPAMKKSKRARGCGREILLWDAAADYEQGKVLETFPCPHCKTEWKKTQLKRSATVPVIVNLEWLGITPEGRQIARRANRRVTASELDRLSAIDKRDLPYFVPGTGLDLQGPQYRRNALSARGFSKVADFYTKRNLWGLGILWDRVSAVTDPRIQSALRFAFTAILFRVSRRRIVYFVGPGEGWASTIIGGSLYIPSLTAESNVWNTFENKAADCAKMLLDRPAEPAVKIMCRHAGNLASIPSDSVDYVFADPPFGSNIYYAEMNRLWEAWLGLLTDEPYEAVVHRKQDGGRKTIDDYRLRMSEVFCELYRVLKPGRWATVEFNNSDGKVFEVIKQAVRNAGFAVENMLFLDKVHKTFKQIKGEKGEEDVVGHDVIFNLRKPAPRQAETQDDMASSGNSELEHLVATTIREHLRGLPERMKVDPAKYTDEHRTTPFLNTVLMNSILKDVNVERINLPFIDRVCGRYFKKIDNRWYLREEAVGGQSGGELFEAEIKDETTAIQWLRHRLAATPMRIGDLRPHWMKATVKLTSDLSTRLERYLRENFWFDRGTRQWRVPTEEERAQLHNLEQQRARHDAERFLADKLQPRPADMEILGWIGHLYDAASFIEQEAVGLSDSGEDPGLPEDAARLYAMMPRLLGAVLKEKVEPSAYTSAQRQCRLAAYKLNEQAQREKSGQSPRQPGLFDGIDEEE
jgi:16S rRNA G966 N2-methylase RsmD